MRLPFERVDQPDQESAFAFSCGAVTALTAPQAGIEQVSHGIAEHVETVDLSKIVLNDGKYQNDELTFSTAETMNAGTILARDSSSLKLVPFVKGGSTNENGIPKAMLIYDVTAAAAGDENVRVLIAGEVSKDKLIINADGDASNVDAAVRDQLRGYGIITVDVTELSHYDNN